MVKEHSAAHTSERFRRTSAEGRSRIFIAHVRKATTGEPSEQNCHPFQYGQWLFAHNGSVDRDSVSNGLKDALQKVGNYSSLNFLLSDGAGIYAFRNASQNPDYYSLYYLVRAPSGHGSDKFRSDEVGALLHSKCLRRERAVLVCSEKLTGEAWKQIPMGYLLSVDENLILNLVEMRKD